MSLGLLGLTILIFYFFYKTVTPDIRHPVNLFLLAWIAVFTLLQIPIIRYTPVSGYTYFLIFLSILTFTVFGSLGGLLRRKSRTRSKDRQGFFISTPLLLVLGTISLATALLSYQQRFGLAVLLTDPGYVRANDYGGTGLLGLLIFMPTVIFTLLVIQASLKRRLSWPVGIYLIAVVAYILILPERTTAINTLLWVAFSLWASQRGTIRINSDFFRRYGRFIIGLPLAIILFFVIVSQRTQKILYLNAVKPSINTQLSVPSQLIDPYIYVTASVPALDTIVANARQRNEFVLMNPEKTAIFPRRIYQIFTGGSDDLKLTSNAEFVNVPFKFNTYTWLYEGINDYGIFGALIYVGLCAIFAGLVWAYRNWVISPFSCYLCGWAGTSALFTVLTNKFSGVFFTYSILIVIVLLALTNGLNLIRKGSLRHEDPILLRRRPISR